MEQLIKKIENNWRFSLIIILLLNFALRLLIFSKTNLFNIADYQGYLMGIEKIDNESSLSPGSSNYIFTLSYIGYYAKYILGSLDVFFVFNCFLGTITTFIIALLVILVSGKAISGVITAIILSFYTEFMVFSSVFYNPVIMLFILVLFILALFKYFTTNSKKKSIILLAIVLILFILTFLFKPELFFSPFFLLIFSFILIRKHLILFQKSLTLVLVLLSGIYLIYISGLYKKPDGSAIVNDFIFFGHTDYGGDGGEGAFINSENKIRYNEALSLYYKEHSISNPNSIDRNRFQYLEIRRFITHHPIKWASLQFTKFFRTFGVVPETTSFKVLYTGIFKGNLWLTSIVVVAPVAIIILLFIIFFNYSAILELTRGAKAQRRKGSMANPQPAMLNAKRETLDSHAANRTPHAAHPINYFLYIYLLLFIYYIIATIFFGQYQERYRLPVMVVFIIPVLSYFIAKFDKENFVKRSSLITKGVIIALFLIVWTFQAKKAIGNKQRLENAIESTELLMRK